jgi:hypothetical protein
MFQFPHALLGVSMCGCVHVSQMRYLKVFMYGIEAELPHHFLGYACFPQRITLNWEIRISMTIILDTVHCLECSVTLFWKLGLFPSSDVREMLLLDWTIWSFLILTTGSFT